VLLKVSSINLLKILIIAVFLFGKSIAYASGYTYEKREIDKHIIHIININPKDFQIDIVKANDGYGRETVSSIASRSKAEIAINGGFFEIGSNIDGKPSGTLIIKGHTYHIKDQRQPLLVIEAGALSISQANPKDYASESISMISGIPLLISDSKITQDLEKKKNTFYTTPHARTALGIKSDGTIVIVVAEHNYQRDLKTITMGEVQSLLTEKGKMLAQKYHYLSPGNITLNELKKILKEEFTSQHAGRGLTILELAQFMRGLGCQNALNLDGGGSSTLWIQGEVVNQTIGDTDERNGLQTARAVSDAIIFKKR
jgi:exopolysaccharide biosynthesis protein